MICWHFPEFRHEWQIPWNATASSRLAGIASAWSRAGPEFLLMIVLSLCLIPSARPATVNATPFVENLGDPFEAKLPGSTKSYARNVWDMQVFGDRIYLGYGNSSNLGPATSPGATDIWTYRPDEGDFAKEFTVDEEQIDVYRIINGSLYVPGHDPREGWDKGNFYRLENSGWVKHRTIPNAIHTYDILGFEGKLYAALGSTTPDNVAVSEDDGQTWKTVNANFRFGIPPILNVLVRAHTLFTFQGKLYVSSSIGKVSRLDGDTFEDIGRDLFPGVIGITPISLIPGINGFKVARPTEFKDHLIYIAGENVNDHQWTPRALLTLDSNLQAQRISLPNTEYTWDLLVRDGVCYALGETEQSDGSFRVNVSASRDLQTWDEILRFQSPTFARSFELYHNDFYFGLGSETDRLSDSTGSILRVAGDKVPFFASPLEVSCGPDLTVTRPDSAVLSGSITDNALLMSGGISVRWTQVEGPSAAAIEYENDLMTKASFPAAGVYVFRLSAQAGTVEASDTLTVTVLEGPHPVPVADPGGPYVQTDGQSVTLNGDRSYSPGGGSLSFAWDVDDDGVVEGREAQLPLSLQGVGVRAARLTVCDEEGVCSSSPFSIRVARNEAWAGDMNGDRVVTPADVTLMLQVVTGLMSPTSDQAAYGDVDQNGIIDVSDAMRALRFSLNGGG
jgi:hypothetical protein